MSDAREPKHLPPDVRKQIEAHLGRNLTDEELVRSAFDDLSRAQLEVVAKLAERRGILASNYVHGVVPSAEVGDVREFVLNVGEIIAGRVPISAPRPLRMEPVYERELGRPLSDEERRTAASLQSLSAAQLAVATQLALKDVVYAMAYLSEVAKSASDYDREMFAEGLKSRAT